MQNADETSGQWKWVGLRLIWVFLALLFVALTLNFLAYVISEGVAALSISLTLLFGIPYILGALAAFLTAPNGKLGGRHYTFAPLMTVPLVLVVGGLILREGIVCIMMAFPLWIPMAFGGSLTVRKLQKMRAKRTTIASVFDANIIACVFALLLAIDLLHIPQTERFTVTRSVVLDAEAGEIWPHLLDLQDIQPAEGRWNFAQNIMQIPRPSAAVVQGQGIGAVRYAKWGSDIRFEEHITQWEDEQRLVWAFAFPDDSISRYTDPHISPDGEHLKILEGGYVLTPLPGGRTKLTLHTRYDAKTPINLYAALWGEIALGGIQSNILKIIEGRV